MRPAKRRRRPLVLSAIENLERRICFDTDPFVSVGDVSVTEGTSAAFVITLSAQSECDVTVFYGTSAGTAISGTDFTASSGSAIITAGQTTQTVSVATASDALDEEDETFWINLSSAVNATVSDGSGMATIGDDDAPPTVSVADAGSTNEGLSASFTLSLSAPSGKDVTVFYGTSAGTATSSSDFVDTTGSAVIAAGQTSQTVLVATTSDSLDEDDETFWINLSGAVNATVSDGSGMATIIDDDAPPSVSVADAGSVNEGLSASFTLSLSAPSGKDVTVFYGTSAGTATSSSDFVDTTGSAVIAAGQTSQTVLVATTSDSLDEDDETFWINLSGAVNATVSDGSGMATIIDDDAPPSVSVADAGSVNEGLSASFTLSLSAPSGKDVTVFYGTSAGTATSSSDFVDTTGSAVIAAGQTSQTILVASLEDSLDEEDETFWISLSGAVNATVDDGSGLATILDNDAAPSVCIADAGSVTEGGSATFTLNLSAPSGKDVTVFFETSAGTATPEYDFTPINGSAIIAAGQTSQTITVATQEDSLDEDDETFSLNLTGASNATVSGSTGTATIVDNDAAPSLSIGNAGSITEGASASFTLSLSAPSGKDVTVYYGTSAGTATAGTDFRAASASTVLVAGVTSRTIAIATFDDTLDEDDESFQVSLGTPVNATLATSIGTATIVDNDLPPVATVSNVDVGEGISADFAISLSAASSKSVTLQYGTLAGTAYPGTNYTGASGSISFNPGEVLKHVLIETLDDIVDSGNLDFSLGLSNAIGASLGLATAVATILDDDAAPSISVGNVSVNEGSSASLTISLSKASDQNVSVSYATSSGSATTGDDFTAASGTVVFQPGQTTKTVAIATTNDSSAEPDQTFSLSLSNAVNGNIANGTAVVTILDDDSTPTISITGSPQADEVERRRGAFTFSRTGSTANTAYVYFSVGGDATYGPLWDDYALTNVAGGGFGSFYVTIPAGSSSQTVEIVPIPDNVDEPTESVTLTAVADSAYTISGTNSSATGTILDGYGRVTLKVKSASGSAYEDTGTVSLRAKLWGGTGYESIGISIGGTAKQGTATTPGVMQTGYDFEDYRMRTGYWWYDITASSMNVYIESSDPSDSMWYVDLDILPKSDPFEESDETVVVTLAANSDTQPDTNAAPVTATILNDDTPNLIQVAVGDDTASETNSGQTADEATFVISRLGINTSWGLDVYFKLDGSAVPWQDYRLFVGSTMLDSPRIHFNANQSSVTIRVVPTDDVTLEQTENIRLEILPDPKNQYTFESAAVYGWGAVALEDNETLPPGQWQFFTGPTNVDDKYEAWVEEQASWQGGIYQPHRWTREKMDYVWLDVPPSNNVTVISGPVPPSSIGCNVVVSSSTGISMALNSLNISLEVTPITISGPLLMGSPAGISPLTEYITAEVQTSGNTALPLNVDATAVGLVHAAFKVKQVSYADSRPPNFAPGDAYAAMQTTETTVISGTTYLSAAIVENAYKVYTRAH